MPFYDLKCEECSHELKDKRLSFAEKESFTCPECDGKMVSIPGGSLNFKLEGGGWADSGYGPSHDSLKFG